MKVSIFIRIFAVLLVALFTLSGCSYVKFEESLKTAIKETESEYDPFEGMEALDASDYNEILGTESNSQAESETEADEEVSESSVSEPQKENNDRIVYTRYGTEVVPMKLIEVGETCSNVTLWQDYEGNVFHNGTPGVSFTLNSVEVYDNFYEAGVDPYGLSSDNEYSLRENAFILLEFTAKYEGTENSKDRIMVYTGDIYAFYIQEKVNDYHRAGGIDSREPYITWFSDRPEKDDPELDYIHQGTSFMINKGEEFTFQLGVKAGHEYIKNKNVFIQMGYINPKVKGASWTAYEIFPDEENEKYMEKPVVDNMHLVDRENMGEIQRDEWWMGGQDFVSKTVGGTFPAFIEYEYNTSGETGFLGQEGLYLTLDNVEVYNSFNESGVDRDKLYYYMTDGMLEGNNFIVVDITAEYKAPEGGPETIKAYANLDATRLSIRQTEQTGMRLWPTVVWYDGEHGEKGDYTAYTISDGEKYHYRLGILTDPIHVKDNNVFLRVCYWEDQIEDYVFQFFDVLPVE
ncbi:MAG: hypothetical protein E7564_09000 [Ruminococcaceae bacterium]|nr:hypothetical protein [Oscillospiraceae bacterium]